MMLPFANSLVITAQRLNCSASLNNLLLRVDTNYQRGGFPIRGNTYTIIQTCLIDIPCVCIFHYFRVGLIPDTLLSTAIASGSPFAALAFHFITN